MRRLAYIFNCALALSPMLQGCVSGSSDDPTQTRSRTQSAEKKGFKIAPPSGSEQVELNAREARMSELLGSTTDTHDLNSEIKLPASALGLQESDVSNDPVLKARRESRMTRSDAEILANFGGSELEKSMGDVDRTLNLSEANEGQLKPSYLTVTQRIRNLFAARKFEEALVEVNELMLHYPNSALLWTMKGTLHLRLRNTDLSIASYEKAFEFEPSNQLQAQIESLRRVVYEREQLRQRQQTPEPVRQDPSQKEMSGLGGQK
jgi:tetratricopeptide (TPR) repeat protein